MICSKCNAPNKTTGKFCMKCGEALTAVSPPISPANQPSSGGNATRILQSNTQKQSVPSIVISDGQTIPLATKVTIGRDRQANVTIDDERLSRNHFVLENQQGLILVTDLNSSNGTFVNGTRITSPTYVKQGSQIKAGNTTFTFSFPGQVYTGSATVKENVPSSATVKESVPLPNVDPNAPKLTINGGREESILGNITVGRATHANITISDERMSQTHFRLENQQGRILLADLNSSNGTFVNDIRVTSPVQIKQGDRIKAGRTNFSLRIPGAPVAVSLGTVLESAPSSSGFSPLAAPQHAYSPSPQPAYAPQFAAPATEKTDLMPVFLLIGFLVILIGGASAFFFLMRNDTETTPAVMVVTNTPDAVGEVGESVEQTVAARNAEDIRIAQTAEAMAAASGSSADATAAAIEATRSADSLNATRDAENALWTREASTAAENATASAIALAGTQTAENQDQAARDAEAEVTAQWERVTPEVRVVNRYNSVNVRRGPDTLFEPPVDFLRRGDIVSVIAKNRDGSWFLIEIPGGSRGWVAESVTEPVSEEAMSKVEVAATIPPIPTLTSTPTPTPTSTPTLTATPPPAPSGGLNPSISPAFGSVSLSSGFWPDPFTVEILSGGNVDMSAITGGRCDGFVASGPDFNLDWSSGGSPFSIFFNAFNAGSDTTLIVRDPVGNVFCNDDLNGLNPGMTIGGPSPGRYHIWIGSFQANDQIRGVLSITEL